MSEIKLVCVEAPKPPAGTKPSPITISITCTITLYITIRFIFPIQFCPPDPGTDETECATTIDACEQQGQPPSLGIKLETELDVFTIKIGSFQNRMDAELRAASLRALRVKNFIVRDGSVWVVCVGKYPQERRAGEMLKLLKQHGIKDAVVLSPRRS